MRVAKTVREKALTDEIEGLRTKLWDADAEIRGLREELARYRKVGEQFLSMNLKAIQDAVIGEVYGGPSRD